MRSREIRPAPSLHRASTDALIIHAAKHHWQCHAVALASGCVQWILSLCQVTLLHAPRVLHFSAFHRGVEDLCGWGQNCGSKAALGAA